MSTLPFLTQKERKKLYVWFIGSASGTLGSIEGASVNKLCIRWDNEGKSNSKRLRNAQRLSLFRLQICTVSYGVPSKLNGRAAAKLLDIV